MKKRYALLDLLRVLAILLVLNSHFDTLYPIPALATGGAAGNGLFFAISGFCLTMQKTFPRHMGRRILRLYPGVLIAFLAQVLLGTKELGGMSGFVAQLIWPTAFWFVGAIVLFDALLYWLDRWGATKHPARFVLVVAALYFAAYFLVVDRTRWSVEEPGLATPGQCFKLIYCFCIYALGYIMKKRGLPARVKEHAGLSAAASAALFVFSFAFKLVLNRWPAAMPLQFLTQLAIVGFACGAVASALLMEEWWQKHTSDRLRRAVAAFSGVSLEMYLVQFPVIGACEALPFPVNAAAALAAVSVLAFLLHAVDSFIFRKCDTLFF